MKTSCTSCFFFQKIQTIWVCRWIYVSSLIHACIKFDVIKLNYKIYLQCQPIVVFLSSPQKCYKKYNSERQRHVKFIISSMDLDLVSTVFRQLQEKKRLELAYFSILQNPSKDTRFDKEQSNSFEWKQKVVYVTVRKKICITL